MVRLLLQIQMIPKYTSAIVHRFIKPLSQPYLDLANMFASNNSIELNTIINKHAEVTLRLAMADWFLQLALQVFNRDQNMGLVKQVASVLYKKNIQRLTKTFLTLSLSDVASRVGLPGPADAEKYILHMVSCALL